MARLELSGVKKRFGQVQVIHGIDLEIEDGEFVVFVGPSGCGKSTALRMIAGLETLSDGDITIGGKSMRNVSPAKRGTAMVFQSYALYPHMTVAENMGFSLRMGGVPKAERREKVQEAARILQLEALLDRKPKELSGGQRQRVAIGRAIVRKPEVFLFDEPLSNLDAELRVQMRFELARLHRELQTTMIYVTHDQVEAMTLADRIVVLRNGSVEQVGSPMDLYHRPSNVFVATFIGSPRMNLFQGTVEAIESGKAVISFEGLQGEPLEVMVRNDANIEVGSMVSLGIRPEHMSVDGTNQHFIEAKVEFWEQFGDMSYAYAPDFGSGSVIAVRREAQPSELGRSVRRMSFSNSKCYLFDADGRTLQ
jgi:lactose/L-arabinose transport system ATP-binding protein